MIMPAASWGAVAENKTIHNASSVGITTRTTDSYAATAAATRATSAG